MYPAFGGDVHIRRACARMRVKAYRLAQQSDLLRCVELIMGRTGDRTFFSVRERDGWR